MYSFPNVIQNFVDVQSLQLDKCVHELELHCIYVSFFIWDSCGCVKVYIFSEKKYLPTQIFVLYKNAKNAFKINRCWSELQLDWTVWHLTNFWVYWIRSLLLRKCINYNVASNFSMMKSLMDPVLVKKFHHNI